MAYPVNSCPTLCVFSASCPDILPQAWRGSCYGIFSRTLSYFEAQAFCRTMDSDLVWIIDQQEQHFLEKEFFDKTCVDLPILMLITWSNSFSNNNHICTLLKVLFASIEHLREYELERFQ